jgi:hypothetical protein
VSADQELSSTRPKDDAWGVRRAVEEAAAELLKTGHSPHIPAIAILKVKLLKTQPGEDGPVHVPVVELVSLEALNGEKARQRAHLLILEESQKRLSPDGTGQQTLPFELKQMIDEAFGGRDPETVFTDRQQADEDADLSDVDRCRKHLIAVHGYDQATVDTWEVADVWRTHDNDHDALDAARGRGEDNVDGTPVHERDWHGWTRVDLAAAEAESDGADAEKLPEANQTDAENDEHDGLPLHMIGGPSEPAAEDAEGED